MSNRRWNTQNIPAKMKVSRVKRGDGTSEKGENNKPKKLGGPGFRARFFKRQPPIKNLETMSQQAVSRVKRKKFKKGSFPDMSGDGKITQKDILIAKGVIKKPKNKNGYIKKGGKV